MIAQSWILFCGFVLATDVLATEGPLSRKADVEPQLAAPELEVLGDGFTAFQSVDESYRLPNTTFPTHYDIHLRSEIHTGDRNFLGSVDIHLTVLEATNNIVVHHRGLSIQSAQLKPADNSQQVLNLSSTFDPRIEHLTLTSGTLLTSGDYIVTVTFTGRLATNEDGFYISSYVDVAGSTKYLATTQFESTSARMAFPCYDEPGLKATFTIWITHHESYSARSNMDFSSEKLIDEPDYQVTKFAKTPVMSTYLLAFVVSDFVYIGDQRHSVYARPNAIGEAHFALEAGEKVLLALNDHLGIDYYTYVPEMKQFAIPDFAAGAMENWGLVTYR